MSVFLKEGRKQPKAHFVKNGKVYCGKVVLVLGQEVAYIKNGRKIIILKQILQLT